MGAMQYHPVYVYYFCECSIAPLAYVRTYLQQPAELHLCSSQQHPLNTLGRREGLQAQVKHSIVLSPDPTLKRREKGLVTLGYFLGLVALGVRTNMGVLEQSSDLIGQ